MVERPLPLTLWGTAPGPYEPRDPILGLVRSGTPGYAPTPAPDRVFVARANKGGRPPKAR